MMFAAVMILLAAPAQTPPAQPAPPVKEKKICRSETSTSSRLDVKRTCLTRAQWDEYDRQAGAAFGKDLDRSRQGSGGR